MSQPIHVRVSPLDIISSTIRSPEWAFREAICKAMTGAGIPYIWKLSEDSPRPSEPGKLTVYYDPTDDIIRIIWTPEEKV